MFGNNNLVFYSDPWGALHKIGRFRNVPTVGTFVNEFNFNLFINVPTVGTFRKRPILCNAPQVIKVLAKPRVRPIASH